MEPIDCPNLLKQPDLLSRLHQHLERIPDPRVSRTRLHSLKDILLISLAATLCLAEGFEQMERWAKIKKAAWFRENLGLELLHGIPHHDTFRRVLTRLPPQVLTATLQSVLAQMAPQQVKHIALDGKELRGSFDAHGQTPCLHLLHAFATEQRLLLACRAVDSKSNEIPAAQALIAHLCVAGAVVTADAMHCQKETAAAIVSGKGDYVLAVKENQHHLHAALEHLFAHPDRVPVEQHSYWEKNRGRQEMRCLRRVAIQDWLPADDPLRKDWSHLSGVLCLERTRQWTHRGQPKSTHSRLYFISSRSASASAHQDWIRGQDRKSVV